MYIYKYANKQKRSGRTHAAVPSSHLAVDEGEGRELVRAPGPESVSDVRMHINPRETCPYCLRGEIKQTLTAFIDLFQLIHRRKGEKLITGLTTNS